MSIEFGASLFPVLPLKRLAVVKSSNVDKVLSSDENTVRLCNYLDVYNNDLITSELDFSAGSANQKEIEKFGLKVGDVIITKDSETPDDIAIPAFVGGTADDLVCGYHLALLRPIKEKMDGRFLFYFLKSHPARAAFYIRAQGITRFGLTIGGIGSVLCPAPQLLTQKRVVEILDVEIAIIDRLIEKAGGQEAAKAASVGSFLSLLLEQRATLITAAVTGQFDVTTWGQGRRSRPPS